MRRSSPAAAAWPHYEPHAVFHLGRYHLFGLGGLQKNRTAAFEQYELAYDR